MRSVSISWQTLRINATGGELDRTENEIVAFEKEVRKPGRRVLSDRSLRPGWGRGFQTTPKQPVFIVLIMFDCQGQPQRSLYNYRKPYPLGGSFPCPHGGDRAEVTPGRCT